MLRAMGLVGAGLFDVRIHAVQHIGDPQKVNCFPIGEQLLFNGTGQGFFADVAFAGNEDQGGLLIVAFPSLLPANTAAGPFQITLHDLLAHLLLLIGQRFANDAAAANLILVHDDKPS